MVTISNCTVPGARIKGLTGHMTGSGIRQAFNQAITHGNLLDYQWRRDLRSAPLAGYSALDHPCLLGYQIPITLNTNYPQYKGP